MDVPYKKLTQKQAEDIAKAMARNDAKRLEDVLGRVGGIDGQAFKIALAPDGHFSSLMVQQKTSGSLLARTLARAPDEAFDAIAQEASPSAPSFAFTRAISSGLGRSGAGVGKMARACLRAGPEAMMMLACYSEQLASDGKGGDAAAEPRKKALWTAEAGLGAVEILASFEAMGLHGLAELAGRFQGREPPQVLAEAMARVERSQIACAMGKEEGSASHAPKRPSL